MPKKSLLLMAVLISVYQGMSASAAPCDALYQFDGDLTDASGGGHIGMMIGKGGVPNAPRFVEGRSGQALMFDGTSAVRVFLDLAYERCPQITVAAWIKPELHPQQVILGTSHGLFLMASNSDIGLRTGGEDLWARQAVYQNAGWMFVAATWDMQTGKSSVHWRDRSVEGTVGNSRMETESAIWFGALNDNLDFVAKNLVIDELQIIGRSLDKEQIMALQNSKPPGGPDTAAVAAIPDAATTAPRDASDTRQPARTPVAVACAAPGDCAAGSYCALDQTCHPERHRPMPQQKHAIAPIQNQTTENVSSATDGADSRSAYLVCSDSGDCATEDEQCYHIRVPAEGTDGSMCTHTCTTDAECSSSRGFTGACYALAGNASACYQRCDARTDCYIGNDCISLTLPGGTLDAVCVPN